MTNFYAHLSISKEPWWVLDNIELRKDLMSRIQETLSGTLNLQQKVFLYYQFSLIANNSTSIFTSMAAWALFKKEENKPTYFQRFVKDQMPKLNLKVEEAAQSALNFINKNLQNKKVESVNSSFMDLMLKDKYYAWNKLWCKDTTPEEICALVPNGIFRVFSKQEITPYFSQAKDHLFTFAKAVLSSYDRKLDQNILHLILSLLCSNDEEGSKKLTHLYEELIEKHISGEENNDAINDLFILWPNKNHAIEVMLGFSDSINSKIMKSEKILEFLKNLIEKLAPQFIIQGAKLPDTKKIFKEYHSLLEPLQGNIILTESDDIVNVHLLKTDQS